MLSFVLCDDNELILSKLAKMLDSLFIKYELDSTVSLIATEPSQVLDYINNNTINVLLLDIDLKSSLSGLDLAEKIRAKNKDVYIIFTSAHLEFILVAYKYKTFDFIPKPITLERLEETILRLIDDIKSCTNTNSFIRLNNNSTIINADSIYFIKKQRMKSIFYTDNREYEIYKSFSTLADDLPKNFIRCHKSYMVNINKISDICQNDNSISFNHFNKEKCFIGPPLLLSR